MTIGEIVKLLASIDEVEDSCLEELREHLNSKIDSLSYNTKELNNSAQNAKVLFIVKGNFKAEYLDGISGLKYYISEEDLNIEGIICIKVKNVYNAMTRVAKHFYGNPDEKLIKIGITGTKGKTSTLEIMVTLLQEAYGNKVGWFGTEDNCIDGYNVEESKLTTPDSLELWASLALMVESGVKYLVMEVSSQAYKIGRVFNILYDYGIFLNISPDHISPTEHATYEDYFKCKSMLAKNSKVMYINSSGITEDELAILLKTGVGKKIVFNTDDYTIRGKEDGVDFNINNEVGRLGASHLKPDHRSFTPNVYHLNIIGEFNVLNAYSCIDICKNLGMSVEDIREGLSKVYLKGRVEVIPTKKGKVIVDYAHNGLSVEALLKEFPNKNKIVVIGATGDKALNRRHTIGEALNKEDVYSILTVDDSGKEDPLVIAEAIAGHIQKGVYEIVLNREEAIARGIYLLGKLDNSVLFVLGKGNDKYITLKNGKIPYKGDKTVIEEFINKR